MFPKSVNLAQIGVQLNQEFILWVWFQLNVIQGTIGTEEEKKDINFWRQIFISEEKTSQEIEKLEEYWDECYGRKNPWCVEYISGDIKVILRKDITWKLLQKKLRKFGRALLISKEDLILLKNLGLNSHFGHYLKYGLIPFGIAGLINHNCASQIRMNTKIAQSSIGDIIPFSFDYFLDESDERILDFSFDQNDACPFFSKGSEMVSNYGCELWFLCNCLESVCIHKEKIEGKFDARSKRKLPEVVDLTMDPHYFSFPFSFPTSSTSFASCSPSAPEVAPTTQTKVTIDLCETCSEEDFVASTS